MAEISIKVRDNGPYRVTGGATVTAADGTVYPAEEVTALCRCGQSPNKPFCDGTHKAAGFESAPRAG
jgi:CDGSH-type Zn-finger protein